MSSKSHVTITLGRTGQVVRRGGEGSSDDRNDIRQVSGSKRSMRDRLGSNVESSSISGNKRHRGDGDGWNRGSGGVGENDLRFKLMRKKLSRESQSGGGIRTRDLREKLSRTIRSPARDENYRPEPREDRVSRQVTPIRRAEHLVQGESLRRSYSSVPIIRSRSPDRVVHSYRGASASRNMDRRVSPPRNIDRWVSPPRNMDRRVSPPRNMDRNMDELRMIQVRRPIEASRGSPPPRNVDELRQVPTYKTIDDSRRLLPSNGVFESSRPRGTSSVTMQDSMGIYNPLTRMPPPVPPPTNPRSLYVGDNVAELLQALGLGKYLINFQAEEIDMTALRQMGDIDLKDMGIPMGPRKKILLALMPRSRRPPP